MEVKCLACLINQLLQGINIKKHHCHEAVVYKLPGIFVWV